MATAGGRSSNWLAQGIQRNRKRSAPYEDSDQEDEDDSLCTGSTKKQRTFQPSTIFTREPAFGTSLPSQTVQAMEAFISPPVTPTPLQRREISDIMMEDSDMADSQPSSQREWDRPVTTIDTNVPAFVQQDSNLSAISMMDADETSQIERPHTPGIIMRDMTRLEVSPSVEPQRRGTWASAAQQQSRGPANVIMAPTKRFTMGYRADCEKCRNRVPGHYAHPPGA